MSKYFYIKIRWLLHTPFKSSKWKVLSRSKKCMKPKTKIIWLNCLFIKILKKIIITANRKKKNWKLCIVCEVKHTQIIWKWTNINKTIGFFFCSLVLDWNEWYFRTKEHSIVCAVHFFFPGFVLTKKKTLFFLVIRLYFLFNYIYIWEIINIFLLFNRFFFFFLFYFFWVLFVIYVEFHCFDVILISFGKKKKKTCPYLKIFSPYFNFRYAWNRNEIWNTVKGIEKSRSEYRREKDRERDDGYPFTTGDIKNIKCHKEKAYCFLCTDRNEK